VQPLLLLCSLLRMAEFVNEDPWPNVPELFGLAWTQDAEQELGEKGVAFVGVTSKGTQADTVLFFLQKLHGKVNHGKSPCLTIRL
jgi:hypothetical protein